MFVKPITIPNKKTGKRYQYYRLCESYRIGNKVRHRSILNLGRLDELLDPKDRKLLADCIEEIVYKRQGFFEFSFPQKVKELAIHYANIIINNNLLDLSSKDKEDLSVNNLADYYEIDLNSVEHEDVRQVGAEWLCKQTLDRLCLERYLSELGWEKKWIKIAMIYIIARCVFPASDRRTAEWIKQNTGLTEIYNIASHKVSRHHLYKVSRMLYEEKERIEPMIARRTNELFQLDEKIVLYDLTNTYFEGEKRGSKKARYGMSKERRNDAKIIVLGMVTDRSGFVKYSKTYEGNMKDEKTLKETIEDLDKHKPFNGGEKKVIVMDGGIGTEGNLKMLREEGRYDYVAISRGRMRGIEVEWIEKEEVELRDKRGNKILTKWVKEDKEGESILYVKSLKKEMKEEGMKESFCRRFEEGLEIIGEGIKKKGGTKRLEKVWERIGRLKERYPSIQRYYEIEVKEEKGIVEEIRWKRREEGVGREGVYLIRTTLSGKDEKTIWEIYNCIKEIEATFRALKTELKMRPVCHQEDIYSDAHIFGSILAYTVVNTIRYPLKANGIHDDWSNIVRIMSTQAIVTTTMKTRTGRSIYLKKISKPTSAVIEIYNSLGYTDRPFWQKKSVLPKSEKPNLQKLDTG